MKNIRKTGLVFALSLAGMSGAFASEVDCGYVSQWGYYESYPECNVAATSKIITGAPILQMQTISNALSLQSGFGLGGGPLQASRDGMGIKGLAAGANMPGWNAWASGAFNDTELSKNNNDPMNFHGRQQSFTLGGDYRLSPVATVGVSASYDDGNIKPANGGGLKITNSGLNIAPYFAYQFNRNYSVDASAGVGWGTLKSSGRVFGNNYSADTERRFAGVNLNSGHWFGNLQVAGKASLFYSHQHNDADSNGGLAKGTKYLMQGRLGVQTAYWMGNGFMPYVGLAYVNDMARNSTGGASLDKDGFVAGIGLNYFSKSGITGGISYTSEFGRHDVTNNVFTANVNVRF